MEKSQHDMLARDVQPNTDWMFYEIMDRRKTSICIHFEKPFGGERLAKINDALKAIGVVCYFNNENDSFNIAHYANNNNFQPCEIYSYLTGEHIGDLKTGSKEIKVKFINK